MRWLLCVLLALISASMAIPTALLVSGYAGSDGFVASNDGTVTAVAPRGPAAGLLRPGDRIDYAAMTWSERAARPRVGQPDAIPIVRDGKRLVVTIDPVTRRRLTPIEVIGYRLCIAYDLIVPCIGLFVVLRRPSVLTAALFLTCLGGAANSAWLRMAPPQFTVLAALTMMLAPICLTVGFVLFCTRFPDERAQGWARTAEIVLLAAAAIGLALYGVYVYGIGASFDKDPVYYACAAIIAAVLAGAYVTFALRQRGFRGDARLRAQWIDLGLACYVLVFVVFFGLNIFFGSDATARGLAYIVSALQPAPYVITYALTRARILDLRFVGGRTVFYAVLTAVPIAVLGLIDWLAGRFLSSARATLAIEVLATVAMSFGLNAVHRRAEQLVDTVLFRDRRRGERRLETAIASLTYAETRETVERTLTDDVAAAMNLVSAATFVRAATGWSRGAAVGWSGCATQLSPEHPLALAARTRNEPIVVDDVPGGDGGSTLPAGAARPDVLVPIAIRRDTVSFAIYSRTVDGDHLDPLQLALLRRAAEAAALAYERIEVAEQRRSIDHLRAENDALRSRLSVAKPVA